MADTAVGTPIGVVLADLAGRSPDAAAVTDSRRTVSRLELERRTNRLARAYAGLGVNEGDFVTIALPNGIEFVEATIACWKLGAIPQPLSSRLPAPELRAIVDLVAPKVIVGLDAGPAALHVPAGFEPDPDLAALEHFIQKFRNRCRVDPFRILVRAKNIEITQTNRLHLVQTMVNSCVLFVELFGYGVWRQRFSFIAFLFRGSQ